MYLMPTAKGHVFWVSKANGANLHSEETHSFQTTHTVSLAIIIICKCSSIKQMHTWLSYVEEVVADGAM